MQRHRPISEELKSIQTHGHIMQTGIKALQAAAKEGTPLELRAPKCIYSAGYLARMFRLCCRVSMHPQPLGWCSCNALSSQRTG